MYTNNNIKNFDVNFKFDTHPSTYLFNEKKVKPGNRDDRNLDIILQVIQQFPSSLIQPSTKNQQCHLNTIETMKRVEIYEKKSLKEKGVKNEENLFIPLAVLTNRTFNHYDIFLKTIQKGMRDLGIVPKKGFENELQSYLKRNFEAIQEKARIRIIELFDKSRSLDLQSNESLLFKEFQLLSAETKTKIYPIFASLVETAEKVASNQLKMIVKINVYNSKGYVGTIVEQYGKKGNPDDMVMVCDGIATDGQDPSLTVDKIRAIAKGCPKSFFQSSFIKDVHNDDRQCLFCRKVENIDLSPYKERVRETMKVLPEALEAMGVDATLDDQKDFIQIFKNKEKYPILSHKFEKGIENLDRFGVKSKKPINFALCHAYPLKQSDADKEPSLFITSPQSVLKGRGLI